VLGAVISYVSMRLLMWGSYRIDKTNYSKLIALSYGSGWGGVLTAIYIIYTIGSLVTY